MVKKLISSVVVLLFSVTAIMAATAKDKEKGSVRKATGYDVTYNVLSFKNFKSDSKCTQFLLGLNYETAAKGEDKSLMSITAGIRSRTEKYSSNKLRVDSMFGLGIIKNDSHSNNGANGTNLFVEIGVVPELFVIDNLSIEIPLGIRLMIIGESSSSAGDGRTQIATFGSPVWFFPGLSFHYYFGK